MILNFDLKIEKGTSSLVEEGFFRMRSIPRGVSQMRTWFITVDEIHLGPDWTKAKA